MILNTAHEFIETVCLKVKNSYQSNNYEQVGFQLGAWRSRAYLWNLVIHISIMKGFSPSVMLILTSIIRLDPNTNTHCLNFFGEWINFMHFDFIRNKRNEANIFNQRFTNQTKILMHSVHEIWVPSWVRGLPIVTTM